MTPDTIAAGLMRMPLRSVGEARSMAPREEGFYAWWCDEDELPRGVPLVRHPKLSLGLLYVGVAPGKKTSKSDLLKRLRQHTSGPIGSSTFRLGLTALLWEDQGWQPIWPATKVALEKRDLTALSEWQANNLQVQWVEVRRPYEVEAAVIEILAPPMNLDHNEHHEFHPVMVASRDALRSTARKWRDLN